ncbi:hypothetical protein DL96DRAFT_1748038 [Flagelloscypha sp. PMI_526]|nr:hypothetical protein DL96DRAFT_1748038 [Flagelloscypha sp. PMI_526]
MFATPEQIKGEFWLLGTLVAKPGFEDKVQESFTLIAKSVQSGAEPGTLHYTTTRGVGEKSNKFTIIEKYTSPEAFEALFGNGAAPGATRLAPSKKGNLVALIFSLHVLLVSFLFSLLLCLVNLDLMSIISPPPSPLLLMGPLPASDSCAYHRCCILNQGQETGTSSTYGCRFEEDVQFLR